MKHRWLLFMKLTLLGIAWLCKSLAGAEQMARKNAPFHRISLTSLSPLVISLSCFHTIFSSFSTMKYTVLINHLVCVLKYPNATNCWGALTQLKTSWRRLWRITYPESIQHEGMVVSLRWWSSMVFVLLGTRMGKVCLYFQLLRQGFIISGILC